MRQDGAYFFFFSSRRRHTRSDRDWSSDVCSSDLILAMTAGNPESPVNAVPPRAWARGQIRFVVGTNPDEFLPALRRHLDHHGFPMVQIAKGRDDIMNATRLDPEHPWARWAAASLAKTTNKKPAP